MNCKKQNSKLTTEELLNGCHEKMQVCCELYYNTCRGTEEEKWCKQWCNQIHKLIQKSEVTEEFIQRMVNGSVYVLHKDKHEFYKKMLKEAGVEVNK